MSRAANKALLASLAAYRLIAASEALRALDAQQGRSQMKLTTAVDQKLLTLCHVDRSMRVVSGENCREASQFFFPFLFFSIAGEDGWTDRRHFRWHLP